MDRRSMHMVSRFFRACSLATRQFGIVLSVVWATSSDAEKISAVAFNPPANFFIELERAYSTRTDNELNADWVAFREADVWAIFIGDETSQEVDFLPDIARQALLIIGEPGEGFGKFLSVELANGEQLDFAFFILENFDGGRQDLACSAANTLVSSQLRLEATEAQLALARCRN